MIENHIDFMKEEICLNYIDSIQSLIPLVAELHEVAKVPETDNSVLIGRYHAKLREAARSLESYFNLILTIMDDVVIKNIRAEIANTIGIINKNTSPSVGIESCFILSPSYVSKSNKRIYRFNEKNKDNKEIAIENSFIVNPSEDDWYEITIHGDKGIALKKIPMDAVSPQDVIENKLPELLEIADQFVLYIERYRNEMMDKYFSTGMIKIIEGMHRGTVNQNEIFGFLPNVAELNKMYSDVMIINATINAFYVNTTAANTIVNTELNKVRLSSF